LDFLAKEVTIGALLLTALILALGFIPKISRMFKTIKWLLKLRTPVEKVQRLALRVVPSIVGSLFVFIHLKIFDPIFLKLGKVKRIKS
jgi:hypothetical protein